MPIKAAGAGLGGGFAVDTTFVLFFLAVDLGQSIGNKGLDAMISAAAVLLLLVLPYFLPSDGDKPDFWGWIVGRGLIAGFATLLGMILAPSIGSVLPDLFRFLPMTLLILTAAVSCYLQFYAMIKFRLAR